MKVWKMIFLFNGVVFRFHVSLLRFLNVLDGSEKRQFLAS